MAETTRARLGEWRDPMIGKVFFVGVLVLLLLVPISWIRGLVDERQVRHAEVKAELTSTWGGSQTFAGPVLVVPYLEHYKTEKGKDRTRTCFASFLPESLAIDGEVLPEIRSRGIFDVVLYRSKVSISGTFTRPDFSAWKIAPSDVVWDDARLAIGITDLRGLETDPKAAFDGKPIGFEPGVAGVEAFHVGMQTPIGGLAATDVNSHSFAIELGLAGSDELRFVPSGKQTEVRLASRWADPSFAGAYLPSERQVDASGFKAAWRVSYFARPFPQQWKRNEEVASGLEAAMGGASFGVRMIDPVDFYRLSDRAVKYATLFVVLTFLTFALFEILSRLRIHPVQYLLVGLAICLFYLMLLSLSEQVGFGWSYAIGTTATVALVGAYTRSVLGGTARAATVSALLAVLYGYLYVLLQIEDYALLLGTSGLFVILATVMHLTRNLDWYSVGVRPVEDRA